MGRSDMAEHLQSPHGRHSADAGLITILGILVDDFDVIDVLTQLTSRCVDDLDATAAGILLADETGRLRVVGASSEEIQLLELFQLQCDEGPCLDCYSTGTTITAPNLNAPTPWPTFAAKAAADGYRSVYAIPLHHNDVILGCLNVFMSHQGPLDPGDVAFAQAVADVASIAVVQSHTNRQPDDRNSRLRHALQSRITIEQAKGMLAEQFTVGVHVAFEMLRSHARDGAHSLTGVADQLVTGMITVDAFHRPPAEQRSTPELTVDTTVDQQRRRVRIGGELDLATRVACFDACVNGEGATVEVDISTITFMDCSGYDALMDARRTLEHRGGSLSVTRAVDQPAHLLALLAELDAARPTSLRSTTRDQPGAARNVPDEAPAPSVPATRSIRRFLTRFRRWPSRGTVSAIQEPTTLERTTVLQLQPRPISTVAPSHDRRGPEPSGKPDLP